MSPGPQPTAFDFVGAFVLAAACGGMGAAIGHVFRKGTIDERHGPIPRVATFGAFVGFWYPIVWIIAFDILQGVVSGVEDAPLAGGLPAVAAAAVLGVVFLGIIHVARSTGWYDEIERGREALVVAAAFAVVLPVSFGVLLRVLFPPLVG